jgi:DNA-binding transcriptional LysR family regulator
MARNLDTNLLRAFVAVAETAGMTAAGNVLNLTQAAVSQQIKRLEEALGCQLFDRHRSGLRLTEAGDRLFGKAKRMLALNDEIWSDMTRPLYDGEVRIGVPYDLVNTHLPPVLRSFARSFPGVKITLVSLTSKKLLDAIAAGKIDIALAEQRHPDPGAEVLAVERLVWVGAKGGDAYAKRPLPVSFGGEDCAFRPPIVEALAGAGIEWWPLSEIGNIEALNATVHTDLAVMGLLASTVPTTLEVLGPDSGLPALPTLAVTLHLPKTGATEIAVELARHMRAGILERYRQVA